MGLKNIIDGHVRLIMVGGKGGVGKTTCASAVAMKIASLKKRVLIISSDPAPSLSDIFEVELGGEEKRIWEGHELYGLEISSEKVLEKWKERFGDEIYEVISSFANVDYNFIDYIGTAPGIEEEYMLSFIIDLVESKKYDVVVWDTAPAGHTLRLLRLPHLFLKHLEAATKFYMNMYSYFERFKDLTRLKSSRRTLLEIIGSWEALAERIVAFIRDREVTKYILVTIPEALAMKLTERMIKELNENRLFIENIIVNHVITEGDCDFHRRRKNMQDTYIGQLKREMGDKNIVTLPLSPEEVKGIKRLEEVSKILFD
ncbi:MAG: ArsA family ATPase [Syntrophorhabdaceae bacterium]|nr:ArsA family ATPase [Syntrophorhabdaceae bacterium]